MRTLLLIITTALLTALGIIYAWQSQMFPELFSLIVPTITAPIASGENIGNMLPQTGKSCTTPRGDKINHGDMFLSYDTDSATVADGGCVSKSTTCNNGSRSIDEEPLTYRNCTLDTPKPCEVNGFTFSHGQTFEFFQMDETTKTCTSLDRTCTDGTVDGDEAYIYLGCPSSCPVLAEGQASATGSVANCPACPCLDTPKPEVKTTKTITTPTTSSPLRSSTAQPNCPSPTGGTRREPGKEGSFYPSATVAHGQTCEKANVVCSYGSIRYGTASEPGAVVTTQLSSTCSVLPPAGCETACGMVAHRDSVTTYGQSIISHGNGTTCEDIKIKSTCENGVLSPAGGSSCTCQIAPPSACTAPNGQNVAHGSSLTLYEHAQVQAVPGDGADTCMRQWRQCVNGVFHDRNNTASPFTYKYESCTVIAPPAGGGPGGEGVPVE